MVVSFTGQGSKRKHGFLGDQFCARHIGNEMPVRSSSENRCPEFLDEAGSYRRRGKSVDTVWKLGKAWVYICCLPGVEAKSLDEII